jgi:cell division protein DivIC
MLFFDTQDIFTQMRHNRELKSLQASKQYFTTEIGKLNKIRLDITTNPVMIEKIARENYYMKRENEDLFLIPEKQEN